MAWKKVVRAAIGTYRGQVRDFVNITDKAYSRTQILDMEVRRHHLHFLRRIENLVWRLRSE